MVCCISCRVLMPAYALVARHWHKRFCITRRAGWAKP